MNAEDGRAAAVRGRGRTRWLEILLDKLPAMQLPELRKLWASSQNGEPPAVPEALLRRLLAHRLQEHRYGRMPAAAARELARVASGVAPVHSPRPSADAAPGTRLIREWNGQTITVLVREDGYLWAGRLYSSLSKIACEVTGAKWSGPRFFGLRSHG